MPLPWIIGGAAVALGAVVVAALSDDDSSSSSSNSSSSREDDEKRRELERKAEKERLAKIKKQRKEEITLELSRYLDNQKSVLNSNLSKLAYFSAFTPNLEEIKSILKQKTDWKTSINSSHAINKEWSIFNVSKLTDSLAIFQELYQTEVNQKKEWLDTQKSINDIDNEIKQLDKSIANLKKLIG